MKYKILGILFFAFWNTDFTVAQGNCTLTIRGKVVHAENSEPIEGAFIWINEIERGVISDYNGNFRIQKLCIGDYTVTVQYLGHRDYKENVVITSNSNFTFRLEAEDITLEGVEIHGHREAVITTSSVSSIRGAELRIARGETLGETLGRIPGVSSYNTGANISKPVIQGLHSNRIMILNNGIRLEGQQWGTEHAPEIDPFIAKEIAVVKGAETVRFGPEAMGGVILINPAPIPTKAGLTGELDLVGTSNGRMANSSLTISGGSKKWEGLGYRVQGSSKIAGNIKSPDYYQDNTGARELNFSGALGYSNRKLGTELYFSHFQTSIGILSDAHTGNLSDLNGIIENGRPFRNSEFTYQIGNPKQVVEHQLLKFKSHYHLNNGGKLNLQYGFQRNHRKEFDRRRGELNDRASLNLELYSNTLDISFTHMTRKKWNGSLGLNLIQQANSNIPGTGVEPLIPNYDMKNAGIFLIEKYTSGPLEIEGGMRYDYRKVQSARIQNGNLDDREFEFQNLSAFLGGVYSLSQGLTFNSNFGTAWRPPNINEQFSQGLHHGLAAIEIGNPDFVSEQSYKWVNTLNFVDNNFRFELTGFANRINNYIYLSPSQEQFVSLRGSFAVFEYLQTNANLWGGDISVNYTFIPALELYSKGSIVRAKNVKENTNLPFIPADRLETGLIFNVPTKNQVSQTKISIGNLIVSKQIRVPDFDLAPAPPGYFLWNAAIQTSFKISGNRLNLGFQAKNIFNTSYKDYMNRFRYFSHEIGRNFLLKLNYEF